MRRLLLAYAAGLASAVALIFHAGSDAVINVGVRWQAAERQYVVYSEPMREMDESQVASILAEPPTKPRVKRAK